VQDNAENNTTRTFVTAPHAGPEPGPFEASGADRRRRNWHRQLAIAATLAVVATLVVVAVGRSGRRSADPPAPAAPSPVGFDLTGARPVEEVWPDAVIRLPKRLPDGRTFAPKGRLDDDRFVVVPRRGDSEEVPVVYNARTGQITDLITAPVDWREDSSSGGSSIASLRLVAFVPARKGGGTP
jgi:hypothetical protein